VSITREDVRQSIISFVIVILALGGTWKYLDQKRENLLRFEQRIIKEKIKLEILKQRLEDEKNRLENLEKILKEKEKELNKKEKKISSEELLNFYISKFILEYGDIDIHRECLSDQEYMKKYRKANALLDIIEAKAKELGKKEILEKFVWPKRSGIHSVKVKCDN